MERVVRRAAAPRDPSRAKPTRPRHRLCALPGTLGCSDDALPGPPASTPAVSVPSPAPSSAAPEVEDHRYTLGHYYGSTKPVKGAVKQLDHSARRRTKAVAEVVEAGKRQGIPEQQLRANLEAMEALLPELAPDMNKMRAADWARLAKDVNHVAMMLVVIKTAYPGANVGRIVAKAPRTLLKSPQVLAADADVVRRVLASAPNLDSIVEQVPFLMDPAALAQSLANVSRWYNTKDPVAMISKNPQTLLNVEEADLEADPLYGLSLNLSTIDVWDFGQQQVPGATAAVAPEPIEG